MFTCPEPPSYSLHEPFPGLVELNPTPPKPGSSPSSSSSHFFPLSPPAFQNDILHDLLIPPHLLPNSEPQHPIDPSLDNKQTASSAVALAFGTRAGRKRSLRKDRHSKIYTAQGPRDRRMRLSLEVARRFFDLQDMLGFDKPSKTIQWLLNHSKSSIKELAAITRPGGGCAVSSSSSSPQNASSNKQGKLVAAVSEVIKAPKVKKQVAQLTRKASIDPVLAKEYRAMARARARERTSEKKRLRLVTSSAALDTIDESGSHDLKSSLELVAEVDDLCFHTEPGGVYECLMIDGGGAATIGNLDYFQNIIGCNDTASFFQEQWDMHFTGDAQLHAKTWANSNPVI